MEKETKKKKKYKLKIVSFFKAHKVLSTVILLSLVVIAGLSVFFYNKMKSTSFENRICVVKFESNGGSPVNSIEINCGKTINEPVAPKKEGFTFKYWEYNGEKFDFKSQVMVDLLLNAVYEVQEGVEIVTITFDTSGGSEIKPIEIKKGETLEKPVDPTMSGYKFAGWYKNYVEYDFSTPVTENITLKAKWEEASNDSNKPNVKTNTSSSKYKCVGSFRTDVPEKIVTVGYRDHVNWTWSTYGVYGGSTVDVCYVTYKTSDASIASVDNDGIITTHKAGTAYISECVNDTETKTELICFKGKLNIQDPNDTTTVNSKYDEIANKYSGIWYLEGYSDVFIKVFKYKMYYEAMDITPTNVDIYNGGVYPGAYGNIQISYENWDADIKKYRVTLGGDYISIQTPKGTYKFTKTKGTTNRFTNTMFYSALGKWYVYNKPDSYLEVYKIGDDTDPRQSVSSCIKFYMFNPSNFSYDSSGDLGCEDARTDEIFHRNGITISNNEMTITNSNGTVKLYKTKKTVPVSSISLNTSSLNIIVGENRTLSYTISPDNAYNKEVSWSSSNPAVASVSDGVVTAVSNGTTVITVTTKDGGKKATCSVTVTSINVTGVSLNTSSLNLVKGNTSTLIATVEPSNATNKNISWSSSDSSIATVSNGVVTAVNNGTATITVTTQDGSKKASCTVTVSNPPLVGSASVGISTVFSGGSISRGVSVDVSASGGSNSYNYYFIKLYKNGSLIGQTTNTASNSLFVVGHTNGSYYAEFEIRDSDGAVYNGVSNTVSISGF